MLITLIEPSNFTYLRIDLATNHVHLLVPVTAGLDISTDNTCQSDRELKKFFEGGAFNELETYKNTLEFHLSLLEDGDAHFQSKKERLAQINILLEAVVGMRNSYRDIVKDFLSKPSNLYSIQLRPSSQDFMSSVVKPVFTTNRGNDSEGRPLSLLYKKMIEVFAHVVIAGIDPKSRLTQAVLGALPPSPTFETIQKVLNEQCKALFGIDVDFNHYFKPTEIEVGKLPVTQASVDAELRFEQDTTPKEYIDGLLYLCAQKLWIQIPIPTSHFYNVGNIAEDLPPTQKTQAIIERKEKLSILTQFFLANVNVYCRAKNISTENFGVILDASPKLSDELIDIVQTALSSGVDVEERMSQFFNAHVAEFRLTRALTSEDITAIKQKFTRTYQTVTATNENPHMDDFMFLDTEAQGENDTFFNNKGLICTILRILRLTQAQTKIILQ